MAITLLNHTQYPVRYRILKGQQVIALLPEAAPGGSITVPTDNVYTVVASTTLDGNLYTSAPLTVTQGVGFLAEVKQDRAQQTYVFEVVEIPSSQPNQLEFESTWKSEVVFTILKDGRPLQSVVVIDAFMKSVLALGDTYSVSAVINGVTTDVVTTTDPNATITAVEDTTAHPGYFTLRISAL